MSILNAYPYNATLIRIVFNRDDSTIVTDDAFILNKDVDKLIDMLVALKVRENAA